MFHKHTHSFIAVDELCGRYMGWNVAIKNSLELPWALHAQNLTWDEVGGTEMGDIGCMG